MREEETPTPDEVTDAEGVPADSEESSSGAAEATDQSGESVDETEPAEPAHGTESADAAESADELAAAAQPDPFDEPEAIEPTVGPDEGEPAEPETIVLPATPEPPADEDAVTPSKKKRRRGRRAVLIAAGALVLLGGAYVAGAWYLGDRVPGETTVAGVNLSGLPADEAERVLTDGLAEATTEPIDVHFGDLSAEVDPQAAGLALDAEATVASFTGFTLDPQVVFGHVFGLGEQDPVTTVDSEALEATLSSIAEDLDVPPVEGAIAFEDGQAVVTEPVDGTSLDVPGAADVMAEGWLTATGTLELPAMVAPPTVDAEVIEETMSTIVDPMLSGPVTVAVNDESTEITPAELAAAATIEADGANLTLTLDGAQLAGLVTERASSVGESPRDARIELRDGEPRIVPAVTGTGLDPDALAEAVATSAVATDEEGRTAAVELTQTDPEFSTEDAEALGVTEVIGTFRTPYPYDPVRTANLRAGTGHINGTLVMPGEQFSLLDALRPISTANGYTVSGVVVNGFHSEAIGGGLSQVATTSFNAAYESGFTDITHQPHSRWFDRYPMGREATIFDPSIDMVFENNTGYGVLIQSYVTDSHVVVTMWGTDVFDVNISTSDKYNFTSPQTVYNPDPECHAEAGGQQGFTVDVTRTVSRGGEVVEHDAYSHTYSPWNRVICGEEPSDEPSEDASESSGDD
ncbi:VanW family protein [Ruania alba]|uniref:Vancomycin resistance protein YoaR, contains peptidoglycan-binding and VanW domains n=1 Tax=Ruania alba TaxID=648782 RepID=A0A1H5N6R2_9MICO|nr:VanW family protein [Ruania alba]SEE97285.1 Vancomycin resistance protein YoaR, contains peptidoglycan-binding and VanW domains [Ruania alba]